MCQAKWRVRPAGRISLSWVTQGFSRASDETREKIAPSFFARERNRARRSRVVRHGKVQDTVEAVQPPRFGMSTPQNHLAPSIYRRTETWPSRINLKRQFPNITFNHAEHVDRVELLHVSTRSTRLIILGRRALPPSFGQKSARRNGKIRHVVISTTRKRLAPSIRLRDHPKGKRNKEQ